MKVVAVIPSRYGSTRFEGKPLAMIAGKSMIQRVYESAARSQSVSSVAVATDDSRIAAAVRAFGGEVMMTSESHRSGTDRVAEAAELLGLDGGDIVINIQGDQPMVDSRCFDQVVAPLIADPELGMSTLAIRISEMREYTDPKDCKVVMDRNGFALYFSRAAIPYAREANDPVVCHKHLGIYAYTRRFLEIFRALPPGGLERIEKLEQLRALENGYPIKVVLTEYDSPEVDLPEDIARIEKKLSA